MTPSIFIIGFGVGSIVTIIVTLILIAIFLRRIEKSNKADRPTNLDFNRKSTDLMQERNEQERETQVQLRRIADSLDLLTTTYRAR